jgi:hypothetical protein
MLGGPDDFPLRCSDTISRIMSITPVDVPDSRRSRLSLWSRGEPCLHSVRHGSPTWLRPCSRSPAQLAASHWSRGSARVVRRDDEPVEPGDRSTPRGPRASWALKRVGIRSTDFIRASRHRRHVNRPDTWLHPTARRHHRFSSCTRTAADQACGSIEKTAAATGESVLELLRECRNRGSLLVPTPLFEFGSTL